MNKYYLLPAFKSAFRGVLKSILIFIGVMIAVIIANVIITGLASSNTSENMTISYFEFAATIMVFVLGICCIREDARVFIQHGIGPVSYTHLLHPSWVKKSRAVPNPLNSLSLFLL